MTNSHESQRKLTLEDLDRFLELPIEANVEPTVPTAKAMVTADPTPYLEAAAVLAAFDPFQLKPADGGSDAQGHGVPLDRLLPASEPIVNGPQRGLWSLAFSARRDALKRLVTRQKMKHALAANRDRTDTPVQRMFERVVDGAPIELTPLSRDELAALITVIDWTEGILDGLPDRAVLRAALAKADLLAPLQRLAGHGFVDRQEELEQLRQYVFGVDHFEGEIKQLNRYESGAERLAPLFVFGTGGVGKSALLARFILEHLQPRGVPFAYIDLDRPTVHPERPLSLLLEAISQLQPQLDLPAITTDSLIKEITYTFSREESGRQMESVGLGYLNNWYFDLIRDILPADQPVVFFLDTFEEAQFLGPDAVWRLLEFLFALEQSLPTIWIILSGRTLPQEFISRAFPHFFEKTGESVFEDEFFLERIPLPGRPINLGILDEEPARKLLQNSVQDAGLSPLGEDVLNDVIGIVGRNPMCLKLSARLLRDEGIEKLREARSEVLVKLKAEKIQAFLYGRILHHVHGDDVRKVAYPGLIVRRISPDVIREVLAKPCGLKLTTERSEHDIFGDLAKEAALVEFDPLDGSLRHRADVRRAMLADLTDRVEPEVIEQIDSAAVAFYAKQSGAISRAEEIYHRLRLRQPTKTLDKRWLPEAGDRLKRAVEELPAQQRLWLAQKLGITLDESVRQTASQEAWEDQATRTAERFLESDAADKALSVLRERPERLPRSRLYFLEAEAYRFLGKFDEAIRVSRLGVAALTKAGDIDMALELLLKMVVIEETRGNLAAADKLLDEADVISAHSHNEILRLRVRITRLRLQRRLRPDARNERMPLRREALAILTDEMLHKLRSYPVLLREVAAELGKEDARITKAAIETLGIEVGTDAQARAIAQAITSLNTAQTSKEAADLGLTEIVKQFQKTNFDPEVTRKWVTQQLTTTDTQKLGRSLGMASPTTEVLHAFREYFRTGVDSMLYRA